LFAIIPETVRPLVVMSAVVVADVEDSTYFSASVPDRPRPVAAFFF